MVQSMHYIHYSKYYFDGDEVIIPTPYWVSYPEQVKLAGGKPVYVEGLEDNEYKITAKQLREAITEKSSYY